MRLNVRTEIPGSSTNFLFFFALTIELSSDSQITGGPVVLARLFVNESYQLYALLLSHEVNGGDATVMFTRLNISGFTNTTFFVEKRKGIPVERRDGKNFGNYLQNDEMKFS